MRSGQTRSGTEVATGVNSTSGKDNGPTGVTLSGLLNVLDGFSAPTGVLFVMTTNHVEKLDPALLRPGRIDHRLYLGKATDYQKAELYRRFFPERSKAECEQFVEASRSAETMAEFQGQLLALEQESGPIEEQPVREEVVA